MGLLFVVVFIFVLFVVRLLPKENIGGLDGILSFAFVQVTKAGTAQIGRVDCIEELAAHASTFGRLIAAHD